MQRGDEVFRDAAKPESARGDGHVVVEQAVERGLGVGVNFAHVEGNLTTECDEMSTDELRGSSSVSLPRGDSSPDCRLTFMSKSLAHRLAEYACSLNFEDLSPEVVHEVKRRVIDSFGCALGAWHEEPCVDRAQGRVGFLGQERRDHHRHRLTRRRRTGRLSRPAVAFVISITTTPIFRRNRRIRATTSPPRSRSAESVGASGRELITAIALAYEVQCRFCDAASIRARGWDHPTYGAFSTALAAAKLMKLDAEKTRHAVNIAGVNCAAFRQARVGELSHWKGVAFANAARHGVYAALLARAGMTGPAPIFEGADGISKRSSGCR